MEEAQRSDRAAEGGGVGVVAVGQDRVGDDFRRGFAFGGEVRAHPGGEGRDGAEADEDLTGPPDLPFDATEAVVAEGEVELGVVRGAPHVGALGGGGLFNEGGPREGDRGEHHPGGEQLEPPAQQRPRRAEQVAERDPGDDEVGGEGLGVEREPHQRSGGEQGQPATAPDGAQRAAAGEDHEQDQEGVHAVVAGDRDVGGEDRERERAGERGELPEGPAHGGVERGHPEHPDDRLGEQQAEGGEAEQPGARHLHPQREGRLVDGDEPSGVEGGEEEVVPGAEHRPDGGGVEDVGVAVLGEPLGAEHRGECEHRCERHPPERRAQVGRADRAPRARRGGRRRLGSRSVRGIEALPTRGQLGSGRLRSGGLGDGSVRGGRRGGRGAHQGRLWSGGAAEPRPREGKQSGNCAKRALRR